MKIRADGTCWANDTKRCHDGLLKKIKVLTLPLMPPGNRSLFIRLINYGSLYFYALTYRPPFFS
jgi:hypothetical protein